MQTRLPTTPAAQPTRSSARSRRPRTVVDRFSDLCEAQDSLRRAIGCIESVLQEVHGTNAITVGRDVHAFANARIHQSHALVNVDQGIASARKAVSR